MAIRRNNGGCIIHNEDELPQTPSGSSQYFPCFPAYFNIIIAPWQSLVPYPPETAIKNKKRNRNIARETRERTRKKKRFSF
jgi:hypothetical protein